MHADYTGIPLLSRAGLPFKTVTFTDLGSQSPGFSQGPLLALKLDSSISNIQTIDLPFLFCHSLSIFPRLPYSLKFELLTLSGESDSLWLHLFQPWELICRGSRSKLRSGGRDNGL